MTDDGELNQDGIGLTAGYLPGGVPLAAVLAACVAAMEEKEPPGGQRGSRRMPAWKRAALVELTRSGIDGLGHDPPSGGVSV